MKLPVSRFALRGLLLAAAAAAAPIASAATLYWDGNSTTANADGGLGTWDSTTLNWDSLATAGVDSAWTDGSDASFAGTGATVTVSGSFNLNSLTIASGYTLTGGTLGLGGKTITTSGAGSSPDVFINSVISGSGGITLAANGDTSASGGGVGGSLKLGGTNTFTGGVTITSGVVNLDSNFGDASNVVTLNGGGLVDENTSTTFTRNIVVGVSGGVIRTWGSSNASYTGGISGTGTIRRTDVGTQNYTGNFTGSVGFTNQGGTTNMSGNWLSTGTVTASGGSLYLRGQVYDGSAITTSGGLVMLGSINRNSVNLTGTSGSIGLGRTAALGFGSTYNITTASVIGVSTGAWLDSTKFASGYTYNSSAGSTAPLYGAGALNATGVSGIHALYTGTVTFAANGLTNGEGFYAPNASMVINSGIVFDVWSGPLTIGSLSGAGNITTNGPGRTDVVVNGNFPTPAFIGSTSQNKSVAQAGRLATAAVIVGSNNTNTTWSGQLRQGSWSGASASLLKRGTGTLTLTGGSSGNMAGLIVEQGTVILQTAGSFPGTSYYGSNLAVLKGATLSTNASYALNYTTNMYVMGGTFRYLSGDIYSPGLILDGGTVVNDTGAGGFRFGYNADGYVNVLSGLGASTLSGRFQLFGSGKTEFFRVSDGAAARDLVVNANLADDPSYTGLRLTKTGLGTMAFTAASSRSGGTTINAGTMEIAAANALGTGASAGITMGGGTLLINYASSGSQNSMAYAFGGGTLQLSGNTTAVTQGMGAVTIGTGFATINAAPGAGGTTTVNMGSITRSGTATQAFLNLTGTATYTTTQANDATKGRLLGVLLNGGFAMNNGSNTIVAYTGTQISGTTISAGASTDYTIGSSVTGDLSMAAAGATTVGSLTLDSTVGRTVTIGAGNTLRVVDGIFQRSSGYALNFSAGTLTAGSADNTAADLAIVATGGMATGTGMTISSVIANNGTGAVQLVKGGAGSLAITGTNTYTGGTLIQQGRLTVAGSANVGSGAITVSDGGQLYATGNITNAITLNGGSGLDDGGSRGNLGAIRIETGVTLSGALTVNNDSQVTTYGSTSGTISGAVTLNGEMVKTGAGTLTFSNTIGGNGTLYVKEGTVVLATDYSAKSMDLFIGSGATVSNTGTNAYYGNLMTIAAGGTFTTSSYHGKFANINLYGGSIIGTGSGKYSGQDGSFTAADQTVFVGGSVMSKITTNSKIGLNSTRFYVQDVTGNSAPDLLVRGSFDGTGYFGGLGTTRFARQVLATGDNSNHTANTWIGVGHTLEVASSGSMGTGTITLDGGTMRMTSLAGLAEYQISSATMDTTSAGNIIGVTLDNQHHNDATSGTFGTNTTWSYRGKLVVTDASRTIKFSENIDDAAWVKVSGTSNSGTVVNTVVLNDATWNANTTASITLTTGTYDIDVRGFNGGGGYGPVSGLNGNGVAWDINNGTNWTSIGVTTDAGVQVYAAGNVSQTLANSIVINRLSAVEVLDSTDTVTLTGVISGAGMLNKTGSGLLVLSGSNTFSGGLTVTGGELRVSAATGLGTGSVNLLSGTTLTYSGSSNATFTNPIIAERGDATINVSNALATLTLAQGVDNYTTGATTRTITKQGAGSLTIAGLLTGNHLYSVTGGALTISATDASRASANVASGATLTVSASGAFGAVTNAGTSTLSSTSTGALTNTAGTLTANSATTVGAISVSGGTLSANAATALSTVTVTGGTLNATGATSVGNVSVSSGTANLTALTTSGTLSITGGAANLGAGSYGATTLSNGTLSLGAATLASINKTGGTLNIGAVGTAATLTATGNSTLGGVLNFDLSNSTSSGNDLLTVGGTLNLSALTGVTFNLTSGALATGTYTLVTSAGITGPTIGIGSVTKSGIASGATRQTYTLSTGTIANALTLDVAGAVGTNTFANGGNDVWSVNSTDGAWTSTATDQWFFNADIVTFGDLASVSSKTVTVSGDVAPGSTTFTNTAAGTAYTLSGTGKITGTTGLTKSGNGRLVLGNTGGNNFSGATSISNGTLEIGAANALSANSAVTISGGTLDVAAVTNAVTGAIVLNSGAITGTTGSINATSVTVNGGSLAANLTGSGSLTFAGGTQTYAKTSTVTGGTTLSSGSLTIASGGSIAGALTQAASTTVTVAGSLGGNLSMATGTTTTVSAGGSIGGNVTAVGSAVLGNAGTITGSVSLANTASALNAGTISGGFTLANTATLTSTGAIAGGGTINVGTILTSSGTLAGNISNSGTLIFEGATNVTYAGAITGTGVIQKKDASVLTLSGQNTAGSVSVLGGTLVLANGSGAVGSSAVTLAADTTLGATVNQTYSGTLTLSGNATLDVASGVTLTRSGGFAGGKTLTKTGTGTLNLQSYGGNSFTSSNLVINAGTVNFNSGVFNTNVGLSTITVNSGGTLTNNTYHGMGGYLAGTPAITVNSGGAFTLNYENYINTIILNGGTVNGGNEVRADSSFSVTVNANSTWSAGLNLVNNNYNLTVAEGATLTQSGYISNSRTVRKSGAGTLVLSGNNSFTGGTIIFAGVVEAANAGSALGTNLASYLALQGGTFRYTGTSTETTARDLYIDQDVGTFDITSATGSLTFSSTAGTLSRAITKTGAGALTLADDISGSGAVTVTAGTLTLNGAGTFTGGLALGSATVNLGTATAGGSGAITTSGASTLNIGTGLAASHTTLGGAGSLTKTGNGSLSLSGANTLAGNLTVSAGTVSLTGSGSLGNGGTVSVASGATLSIGASVSDTQTGLITNAGTLTNAGVTARSVTTSSTFTNTGTIGAVTQTAGTFTSTGTVGDVTSSDGALRLTGTAGAVSLASTSLLNVGGLASTGELNASSLSLSSATVLEFELSDASNSAFYDHVTLSGALDLSSLTSSATLKLFSFDRAAGARGNATVFNQYSSFSLDILTAGSINGSTDVTGDLGDIYPALALDVTGFSNAYTGSWALVAHSGGYRLEYTANIPVVTVDVSSFAALGDSTEGAGFLSQLAGGQTAQVLRKVGAGQLTITESLDHIGGTQINAGALLLADGAALGSGDVTIASGATLEFANTGTFANTVSGAGDIQKAGSGTLELTGAVAITGNLLVQEGTLAADFAPLGGTLEILSGATADFKGVSGQTFAGNLAGAGTARLASGNTLTLSATNTAFTGVFSVSNGTLVLAANNALGTGSADIASGSALTISGGVNLASSFTGAGTLTKTGAGTATLTGSVAHTGTTTVSAGTLKGDFTNASGAISVASGATLEYAIGSDATRGASDITGLGSLTKSGNGKLTLSSAVGLTGGVTVAGGTLASSDFGTASAFTINSGATAELTQASAGTLATVFGGTGTFTKIGNGTLTIGSTGLSTFAGKLRVAQGTVTTAAIANLGTNSSSIELDGGTLAVTASGQSIGSTRGITVGSNGATLNTSSLGQTGTLTIDGLISGTGSLTLASSGNTSASGGGDSGLGIRLTNTSNSFTGDVVITSGLVNYTSNAVFGNSANKIVLNGGGLLDNNGNVALSRNIEVQSGGGLIRTWGATTATFSGALTGTGALSRTDAGSATFTGDLSGFSGTINNLGNTLTYFTGSSAGFGAATINVTSSAVGFSPGRVGSATVNLDGGTLRFEAAGTVGSDASVKLVSGKTGYVNTNGNNVTLANGITGSGTTLEKSGAGTLTLQGAGTATLSSNINATNGTLDVAGQTVSAVYGWISGGTLKVSSGTLSATTNLMIGTGTLEIAGGTVSTDLLRTSEGGGTVSVINQTGGTFNVTGSTIQNGTGNSFAFNHWSGTSTYNLSGGTLNVLNTNINMGWDGNAYINQSGGTANVRGVNMATGRTNAAAYNLTGGRLNIGTGGITSAVNKSVTFGDATVGALANWTGASAMSINAGKTVTFDTADANDGTTARTITVTGAISGSGSLTKVGNGTLNLSGTNTMTGAITVNAGTLGITGTMQGISSLTINSGATASTSVNNFFSAGHGSAVAATVNVNGGTFLLGSGTEARLGNINLNGGTFTSNRGLTSYDILLANVASGAATVTVGGTSASAMNGTGGLHLQGLQNFNVANATGDSAADLVVSLQLSDGGTIGGTGGINKTGAGTMSLTNAANNFTGNITVGAGRLEVAGSGRLNAGSYAGAISNSGDLAFTGTANQTLSGVISGAGSLTKSGNGTLTVSAANTRTGSTTVEGGILAVAATGSLGSGTTTVTGGTLSVNSGASVGSTVALNGGTVGFADNQTFSTAISGGVNGGNLDTAANEVTLSGVLTAAADVTKIGSGTLNISGSGHSVGGAFNINAGTVALSSLSDVTGAFNIGENGTLSLNLNLASDGAFSNALTGTGILSVSNSGSGVFSLANATGFSGGTVNLLSGSFDNTGYSGRIGLLGGFLSNLSGFTGPLSIGTVLTEQQEQALASFTGTLELGAGVTVDITKVNAGASIVVGEGATIDFTTASPEQLSRTITLSGNATLQGAENFTGVVQVAAGSNVTIGTGSIGGGSLEIVEGASVTITGPITNTVVFGGGTIVGGSNLTTLELSSGSLTFGNGGNIDGLSDGATLTVAGGNVNFAGQTVGATIEFSGGTVTNAENFAGTLQVVAPTDLPAGQSVTFVMNGTIGGTITAGSSTVIGGNGTFSTLTMGAGSDFSPGNSPGANTVGNLTLSGGSKWTVQVYSAEGVITTGDHIGERGYDTTLIAFPDGGLNNPVFDLSGASASSRITLNLMTLANWSDSTGGIPTSLLDVPAELGYIDFVIATYGDGVLNMGLNSSISSIFQFNTTGFYKSDGTRAYSGNFSIFEFHNDNTGLNELTVRYSPVPEPSTYGLMLGGLALAAAAYRRRQRKQA